ncbi:MAG: outer membrane protein assembly factor BamD, partial [Proteobacteria bacterium]|nr:outer membrane protein assembly factor BamD [Pseudomonadota bacterium]
MNKIFNGLMVFLVIAFLNGCSIGKDSDKISSTYQGMTAEQLFQSGEVSLAKRDYSTAAKQFEALEAQYPFGKYAEQAQLDIIYAYLKSDQQASAVAAADRFIHLYPRSKFVDYAY